MKTKLINQILGNIEQDVKTARENNQPFNPFAPKPLEDQCLRIIRVIKTSLKENKPVEAYDHILGLEEVLFELVKEIRNN